MPPNVRAYERSTGTRELDVFDVVGAVVVVVIGVVIVVVVGESDRGGDRLKLHSI